MTIRSCVHKRNAPSLAAHKKCSFTIAEENGIDYLPLKGYNLKKLYPKPELRTMGDADVLIRLADFYHVSIDYLLERTDNPDMNT